MEFLETIEGLSKDELVSMLDNERAKRIALEEECDLLAMENHMLRSEIQKLKEQGLIQSQQKGNFDTDANISDSKERDLYEALIEEGDESYVKNKNIVISNACSGMNVISVCFGHLNDSTSNDVVICGGTDKKVSVYSLLGSLLKTYILTAPILCMDSSSSSSKLAVGLMDGKHAIIDIGVSTDSSISISDDDNENKANGITLFSDHNKFVVGIRWNKASNLFATCSRDMTVNLYKANENEYIKVTSLRYATVPESIIFIRSNDDNGSVTEELVIALRETVYLLYVDTTTMSKRKVSMNVSDWDEHVSFNPLYLQTSPDDNFVTIATDKNSHITLRSGSNRRVRSLSGHQCGDYGQPRLCFDNTGKYLYCNSDGDASVLVYSIGQERIVHRLVGHKGIVRGLAVNSDNNTLATGSHDGSVILWQQ